MSNCSKEMLTISPLIHCSHVHMILLYPSSTTVIDGIHEINTSQMLIMPIDLPKYEFKTI